MEINNQKLKIGGLVIIAVLLVLISRSQHHFDIKFVPPETVPHEDSIFSSSIVEPTGTITGSVAFPAKSVAKQAWVCAVRDSTHALYCASKISNQFAINVPAGNYTVFATLANNPYDLNNYRAYYTEPQSHKPIEVAVPAGQTAGNINPADWTNKGDENLIALIEEQQKAYQRYLAYVKAKQEEAQQTDQETTTPAGQPASDQTSLDVGGVPDSEQQSINGTQTAQSH